MREQGMTGAYARGRSEPHRTRADEARLANLLDRGFDGYAPHTHLAGDLTYVRVGGDWAYVCLPVGLANRGIVGHSAGRTRDASLVLGAFATLDFPLTDVQETGVCRPEGSAGPSSRILTLGDNSMQADRVRETERINDAFLEEVVPFAVHGATIVDARGMGIGSLLVGRVVEALRAIGLPKVAVGVPADNDAGNDFWEHQGFAVRDDLVYRELPL